MEEVTYQGQHLLHNELPHHKHALQYPHQRIGMQVGGFRLK